GIAGRMHVDRNALAEAQFAMMGAAGRWRAVQAVEQQRKALLHGRQIIEVAIGVVAARKVAVGPVLHEVLFANNGEMVCKNAFSVLAPKHIRIVRSCLTRSAGPDQPSSCPRGRSQQGNLVPRRWMSNRHPAFY